MMSSKAIFVSCLVLISTKLVIATTIEELFNNFIETFNRTYESNQEYTLRLGIFQQNLLQSAYLSLIDPDAEYGITKFSDLSPAEFLASLGLVPTYEHIWPPAEIPEITNPAPYVNWNTAGYVTPIRDQGTSFYHHLATRFHCKIIFLVLQLFVHLLHCSRSVWFMLGIFSGCLYGRTV